MEPVHVKEALYLFLTEYIFSISKTKEMEACNMQLRVS